VTDQVPFLKIAYDNTSDKPDGIQNGQLYNSLTGQIFEEGFRGLLLHMSLGQAWFPSKYAPDNKLLCSSNDGKVPTGGGESPQTGPCWSFEGNKQEAVCPNAQWSEDAQGKRIPPACDQKIRMVFWDLENGSPIIFDTKKGGLKRVRQIKTTLRMAKGRYVHANSPNMNPYLFMSVRLTTQQEGIYFLPSFALTNDEVSLEVAQNVSEYLGAIVSQIKSMDMGEDSKPKGALDTAMDEAMGSPSSDDDDPGF